MNVNPKVAVPGTLLTASLVAVGTVTAGKRWKIAAATTTNNDSSARTITLHLVPSAGSAGNDNLLLNAFSVAAGKCEVLSQLVGHVLDPGTAIHAKGDVTQKLNLMVSVLEVAA